MNININVVTCSQAAQGLFKKIYIYTNWFNNIIHLYSRNFENSGTYNYVHVRSQTTTTDNIDQNYEAQVCQPQK